MTTYYRDYQYIVLSLSLPPSLSVTLSLPPFFLPSLSSDQVLPPATDARGHSSDVWSW